MTAVEAEPELLTGKRNRWPYVIGGAVIGLFLLAFWALREKTAPPTTKEEHAEQLIRELFSHEAETRIAAVRELAKLKYEPSVIPLCRSLHDIRADVRLAAIETLAEIKSREATEPLCGLLRAKEWLHRKSAAEALGEIGDPAAIPALARAMQDETECVSLAAAYALSRLAPDSLDTLLKALKDERREVRHAAIFALGRVGDPRAAEAIRPFLRDFEFVTRLAAAEALGKLGDAEAAPGIVALYKEVLVLPEPKRLPPARRHVSLPPPHKRKPGDPRPRAKDDPDGNLLAALYGEDQNPNQGLRVAVRRALLRMGFPAVPALGELMKDSSGAVRAAALALIAAIGGPESIAVIVAATADTDQNVRNTALDLLAKKVPKDKLLEPLLGLLKSANPAAKLKALEMLQTSKDSALLEPLLGLLTDPAPEVRAEAASSLRRFPDERAREPLAALLKDESSRVRMNAALALAERDDPRANDMILEVLKSAVGAAAQGRAGDDTLRAAMTALGKSKDTRAVPILVQMVQKNSGGLQHAAMIALGYIGDKAASDVLLGVLKRTDLGARINAATALGRLGEPRAWDDITRLAEIHYHHTAGVKIPAMDALIRIDPARAFDLMLKYLETADAHNVSWYAHLCRRLGESGDPRAVKPMVGLLMHDLPEVRKSAVDGIKTMGEKAVPALIELLRTPDVKVAKPEDKPAAEQARRSFVAVVLSEIGAPAVEGILAALHDKQPKVRVAAAWALGPIGDPRAVAPLIATLKDENEEVQGAAMWALGQSKDKRAIDPLMGFIKHEKLRAAAVEALGVIADDRVLDAILAALKDKDELVREAAAIALGEIGDTRARPALELALNDPVSEVQSAAKNAIFKLRDKRKAEEAPPKTSAPKK